MTQLEFRVGYVSVLFTAFAIFLGITAYRLHDIGVGVSARAVIFIVCDYIFEHLGIAAANVAGSLFNLCRSTARTFSRIAFGSLCYHVYKVVLQSIVEVLILELQRHFGPYGWVQCVVFVCGLVFCAILYCKFSLGGTMNVMSDFIRNSMSFGYLIQPIHQTASLTKKWFTIGFIGIMLVLVDTALAENLLQIFISYLYALLYTVAVVWFGARRPTSEFMFGFIVCGVAPNFVHNFWILIWSFLDAANNWGCTVHLIPIAYCEGTSKALGVAKKAATEVVKVPLNIGGVSMMYDPLYVRTMFQPAPKFYTDGFVLRAKAVLADNFSKSSVIGLMHYLSLDPIRLDASIRSSTELTEFYKGFHEQAVKSRRDNDHMLFGSQSSNMHESLSLFRTQCSGLRQGYLAVPMQLDRVPGSSDYKTFALEQTQDRSMELVSTTSSKPFHRVKLEGKQFQTLHIDTMVKYASVETNADAVCLVVRNSNLASKYLESYYHVVSNNKRITHGDAISKMNEECGTNFTIKNVARASSLASNVAAGFLGHFERGRIVLLDFSTTMLLDEQAFNTDSYAQSYLSSGHRLVEASTSNAQLVKTKLLHSPDGKDRVLPFQKNSLVVFDKITSGARAS